MFLISHCRVRRLPACEKLKPKNSNSVSGLFKHGVITSIVGYAGCQPAKHQPPRPRKGHLLITAGA